MISACQVPPEASSLRPYVPPLLFVAGGLWLGIYGAYGYVAMLSFQLCGGCLGVAGVLSLGCLIVIVKRQGEWQKRKELKKGIAFFLLGLFLGITCGCAEGMLMKGRLFEMQDVSHGTFLFEVIEEPRVGNYGKTAQIKTVTENGRAVTVKAFFADESEAVAYGDIFEARATLKPLSETNASYYWQEGVVATASVGEVKICERTDMFGAILSFRAHALSTLDPYDGQGVFFLRAVLFGDRESLNNDTFYSDVKVVGLAHMVAVSGAHLVIVSAFVTTILKAMRLPHSAVVGLQISFILLYLVCTGIPVSALRAACMAVVSISSFFVQRASSSLSALGVCLCCILVADPQSASSLSLLLSAGATLGILLFSPLVIEWFIFFFSRKRSFVRDSLSLSLSSSVFTLPIAGAVFSQISLISPLTNVLAAPFFAFFCGGGLIVVIGTLIVPAAFCGLLDLMVVCAQAFCEGIELLAKVPYGAIPCNLDTSVAAALIVMVSALLFVIWPRPSKMSLVFVAVGTLSLILILILFTRGSSDEIIMLDVGQGDAFIIRSEGTTLLIDTGNRDTELLSGLANNGIYHLDGVVITHPDDDHYGSLEALRGVVQVDAVYVAYDLPTSTDDSCQALMATASQLVGFESIRSLQVGDELKIGHFFYKIIWPHEFSDEGGNADSLTGLVRSDLNDDGVTEWRALFCGDLEEEQLTTLVNEGALGDIDILKVGHHGSRASLSEKLVASLSPEIALISVGENNRYGHPTPEIIDYLTQSGSRILQTKEEGEVVCRVYQDALEITTLR